MFPRVYGDDYITNEAGFFVEVFDRWWTLFWEIWWFQLANVIQLVMVPIAWPAYGGLFLLSLLQTRWWDYTPTSDIFSILPNAYFYWISQALFLPLPLYGQYQMTRDFIWWLCYPIWIVGSVIFPFLIFPFAFYVAFIEFIKAAIDKGNLKNVNG